MLVGRTAELDRLLAAWRADENVVVVGEPGIGKTALLREAAGASGRRTCEGGALGTLSWLPYLPLARAIGERRLSGDPGHVAQRVAQRVGAGGLLIVDDAHWADPGTLEVIELLHGVLTVACAVRSGDHGADAVRGRLEAAGFATLTLDPLAETDGAALIRATRPEVSAATVRRLLRRCGGNPLLLSELAAAGEGGESLRVLLASRLDALPSVATDAFATLAVAGRPMPASALDEQAASLLARAGLVRMNGGEVEIAHAVFGDLAVERLDVATRRDTHKRLAEAAADPGEAARHHEASGDRDAARAAALAAAEAAAERPAEAATHLAVAARCSSGSAADELRLRAAAALSAALQHEAAEELLAEVDGTDPDTLVTVAAIRSRTRWYLGDVDGAGAAFRSGIELASAASPGPAARMLVEGSRLHMFVAWEPEQAVAAAERGLAAATAAGIALARAEMLLGLAYYVADDPRWRPHLDAGLAAARRDGDTDTELNAANNLITAHESHGEPQLGRALAVEMIARTAEAGLAKWQAQFRAMQLNLDLHAGRYTAVVTAATELLEEPIDARTRQQIEMSLATALVDLGRFEPMRARLDAWRASGALRDDGSLRWLESEHALWGGRPRAALRLAREAVELGFGDPFAPLVAAWAAVDLGEPVGEPLPPQEMPLLFGAAPESMALAALASAPADAARLFAEARHLWRPYHRRGELRCAWGAAEAMRLAGDEEVARRSLLELEPTVEGLGMRPLLARVRRSLRAVGVRRSAVRTGRAATGLTEREAEVMRLVAAGLTNAEIGRRLGISRSTVVQLVGAAMGTLGAASRGQAAAMVGA